VYDVVVVYPMMTDSRGTHVLLGEKKYGLGKGRWVGPGGKVEPGETASEAALRELAEEVGLMADVADLEPIATIDYPFPSRPQLSQRSHAFRVVRFGGAVAESSELKPRWWPIGELPLEQMWSDAKLWLPAALGGHYREGTITIGDDDEVLSQAWR
jgi:8-oxo-dGTP diphosphatase